MGRMRTVRCLGIAIAVLFVVVGTDFRDEVGAQTPARPIEIKVVNYQQLGAAVRQHKGKVVVVDLWQWT